MRVAACLALLLLCLRVGAKSKTHPVYVGTQCHPGALDEKGCPLKGACGVGISDSCVLWKRGLFVYPPGWLDPALPSPRCAAACDAPGSFQGVHWTPSDASCELASFNAWQAGVALRGRKVVFAGDSLLRQLFQRSVAHLRGLTVVAQPFVLHQDLAYAKNSSADALCTDSARCDALLAERGPAADSTALRFRWMPTNLDPERLAEEGDVDVVVVGLLFHLPANNTLEWLLPKLDDLAARVPRLFWVTTPNTRVGYSSAESDHRARNEVMRAWAARTPNARILALDKLREDGRFLEQDGPHFECKVDVKRPPEQQKLCGDSHDVVNLSLLQLLLQDVDSWGTGGAAAHKL